MASLIKKNKFLSKSCISLLVIILVIAPFVYFKKVEASTGYPVPHIVTIANGITHADGQFLPIAQTVVNATTTVEAYTQTYMTYAGTWSGLSVFFRVANATGDTTLTVRKNGVDTAMTVTVPATTTGLFQDLTNTVTVAVGDLISIGLTMTAGSATSIPSITTLFETDSGNSTQYTMTYEPGGYSSSVTNRYFRPAGDIAASITTEANAQNLIQHAGSIESIGVYVSANARTETTDWYARVNGADGNVSVSAAAAATGLQFSATNSDAFVATDLINSRADIASGSGSYTMRNIQYAIVSTNSRELTFMSGNTLIKSSNTGTAWNFAAGFAMNSGAGEGVSRSYPITPGLMSGEAYYVSANTATQTLTYQLRRNAANVNQSVAIATGVTGWVQDTTNSDAFDLDDYSSMNGSRSVAGSGSTTLQNTSMLYTMDEILPTYTQSAYRLFNNANSADVGSALAAQDTPATLATAGDEFRLRMLINVDTNRLDASGQTFKLQYVDKGAGSCTSPSGGTPASYTDVTGATLIAYNDNASPADAAALTANANDPTNGGNTIVNQTYEELNNLTNSQAAILSGQDGKWDFSLIDNGATAGETYCLRVVQSDGTVLGTYDVYPEISIPNSAQSITFSISDNSIGFGTVSPSATSYATGDTNGTGSETVAHTFNVNTNATSGYVVSILGDTLKNGSYSITSCGASCTPSAGSEQFGLRITASGGTGAVSSPYNHASNYAYEATASTSDTVASAASGDSVTTTYSVRYVTNVAATTEAGAYSGAYTYTVTPSF